MTSNPNHDDDPDTEARTVPPYEGRKESTDVAPADESVQDGVRTGGATGPVEGDGGGIDDPKDTPRGEHASPADEQPAEESAEVDTEPDMTGPSHYAGTERAEDQP
jgi:hypothetical protein